MGLLFTLTHLGATSETPDLRIEISGILELVDDHATDMMQKRMFVNCVFDFRDFAEVLEVECPSLTLIQKVTHGQKSSHDVSGGGGKGGSDKDLIVAKALDGKRYPCPA